MYNHALPVIFESYGNSQSIIPWARFNISASSYLEYLRLNLLDTDGLICSFTTKPVPVIGLWLNLIMIKFGVAHSLVSAIVQFRKDNAR
jgi:hypothetical protein